MSVLPLRTRQLPLPGGRRPALRDVSLAIEPGEFCVVAGLSGSGKSTLLRAACGLVPHFHGGSSPGASSSAGLDTREHGPAELGAARRHAAPGPRDAGRDEHGARRAGARAREPRPRRRRRGARRSRRPRSRSASRTCSTAPPPSSRAASCSGWRSPPRSPPRPRLVLLDEPTSQLDPVAGDELIWQLRRLNQEWETAVVLVEHRLERCLAAADRVIAIDGGRDRLRPRPARLPRLGGRARARAADARRARCSRCAGLRPPPTGVKQARAILRAERAACRARAAVDRDGRRRPRVAPRRLRAPAASAGERRHSRRWGCAACGMSCATVRRSCAASTCSSAPGEAVALMGRNGAGKSTLLRHAAGPADADARTRRAQRRAWRCCCRTRATTSSTSASAKRRPPRRSRELGLDGAGRAQPARPLRRSSASGWRWRSCSAASGPAGGARARRAHARDGSGGQARASQSGCRSSAARGAGGDRRHPRLRVRRRVRDPRRAAGRRPRDRGRPARGAARRRLVLRDRDRPASSAAQAERGPSEEAAATLRARRAAIAGTSTGWRAELAEAGRRELAAGLVRDRARCGRLRLLVVRAHATPGAAGGAWSPRSRRSPRSAATPSPRSPT